MMLMIIIHTLARMCRCRAWPLYTIVLLFNIEWVKYASPFASAVATSSNNNSNNNDNNNNFRNDSLLFLSHFERTSPVNTMPHMYVSCSHYDLFAG